MTAAPAAAGQPGRDDLPSRIFRALYQDFNLRAINGIYVAVPNSSYETALSSFCRSPGG